MLKPMKMSNDEDFRIEMDRCAKWAEEVGLTQADIDEVIKENRKEKPARTKSLENRD